MRNKKLVNYAKYGYIFSIPFIVTFCIFTLYPVIYTLSGSLYIRYRIY